ncbi:DNA polymerase [Anatilimnocola aggregata]|nr:DNA polymerase [Anatilimnocola aggregata]
MGTIFSTGFAFDTETTAIDENRRWFTPAFVLGAAYDGQRGVLIHRDQMAAFYLAHRHLPWRMHNAPFDLAVLQLLLKNCDVYALVENNQVWDTQLLHRLWLLGSQGSDGFGQSSLDHCAQFHLGLDLPKDLQDNQGRDVRTGFGRFLHRPIKEIDAVHLRYLATDVIATHLLFEALRRKLRQMLSSCQTAFGFVSKDWLRDATERFGPQTHHIQLRAAIVLNAITVNGLNVDQQQGEDLSKTLGAVLQELRDRLKKEGYQPGQKGCGKALQEILRGIESRNPSGPLQRTATSGAYATTEEALSTLAESEPFVRDLLEFKAVEKMRNTFAQKLNCKVLHPSFNPLVRSGRTSSFGEINSQNLPRDDRVRSCFVAPEGHVFINADYAAIEMATLAQAVMGQLGLHSSLGAAINAGQDPHRLVAAQVTGKLPSEITKQERQQAKAINFGKPGGMGNRSLQRYAQASYGVTLNDQAVAALSEAWFEQFPEMRTFLQKDEPFGTAVAVFFGLTPSAHLQHTENKKFIDHPENRGRENMPHPILASMFLKVMAEVRPQTRAGHEYSAEDIDFFWGQASQRVADLPNKMQADILARRPSKRLMQLLLGFTDRGSVITLTGRLRANATFCARRNTVFQGLAADGAKLALWHLWRAGYAIHNFIHDEVLVAVPKGPLLGFHAQIIRQLLIKGMQEVVPDVRVSVEYLATRRWSKDAVLVRDESGRLSAWEPAATPSRPQPEIAT